MADIPERITESSLDDTQTTEDVETLFRRFLLPVHRFRSLTSPNPINIPVVLNTPPGVETQIVANMVSNVPLNSEPQESLTHTFYRMIGFPVIAKKGSYFSPGFNREQRREVTTEHLNIARKVSVARRRRHALREDEARKRARIFQIQSTDASVYAATLSFSNNIKRFSIVNDLLGSDEDPQTFNKASRILSIGVNYEKRDGSDIETFFNNGTHIIRPIAVDFVIEQSVKPATNKLCAPFLPLNKYRRLEGQKDYLKRPAIEHILRMRLRQQKASEQSSSLESTIFQVFPDANTSTLSGVTVSDLKRVTAALLDQKDVSEEDVYIALEQATAYDIIQINNYVRAMKSLITQLFGALETLNDVRKAIEWTPLPSTSGPAGAPAGSGKETEIAGLIRYKQKTSKLERQIKQMRTKIANNNFQIAVSDDDNINHADFALSSFIDTTKRYEKEFGELKEKKVELVRKGSKSLRTIELITGEISGFGLIDAIAIYAALWAVPVDVLLGLLDADSFDRLYKYNADLRSLAVETRKSSPDTSITGSEALIVIETMVANILSFVDRLFDQKIGKSPNAEGGDIPRS